jgi:hypothetical protein
VQDARFGEFHAARIAGVVMVVAGEMQRAVHHQVRQVVRWQAASGGGLAPDHP